MTKVTIVVPLYIERFQISNSKRAAPFRMESRMVSVTDTGLKRVIDYEKIPNKYLNATRDGLAEGYYWKNNKLYDRQTKKLVPKNSKTVGKPNTQPIAGNDVWAKMHEQVRITMVNQMKESFKPSIQAVKNELVALPGPYLVSAELHTTPKYCDWDLSNFWVYNKVFEDTLKDEGAIKDDRVKYITRPAAFRFIPIKPNEERKMVFFFETDTDPRITGHLMFSEPREAEFISPLRYEFMATSMARNYFFLSFTKERETGSVLIDMNTGVITANIGKTKGIAGKITEVLTKVYWEAINYNRLVIVTESLYREYESFFKKNLLDRGMRVIVILKDEASKNLV
jgi:hypothetical protein